MLSGYLTTDEYARLNNAKVETVRSRIKAGQLEAVKVGRQYLINGDTPWEESRYYNSGRYKKGSTGNAVKSDSKKGDKE